MGRAVITRVLLVVLLGAALLPMPATEAKLSRRSAQAVVAIVDSGINPYHVTFRDNSPLAKKHRYPEYLHIGYGAIDTDR